MKAHVLFWERWIMGWCEIADGLVKVLTLGLWARQPSLSWLWCVHITRSTAMRAIVQDVDRMRREL